MPPMLPLQARPKRRALMYGSSGSRLLIIGRENVKTSVVEATLERKAAMTKLRHIMAIRTIFGFGEMCESKKAETLSVIANLVRAADIVREPRKTKIIGIIKCSAKIVANSFDVILRPVVSS